MCSFCPNTNHNNNILTDIQQHRLPLGAQYGNFLIFFLKIKKNLRASCMHAMKILNSQPHWRERVVEVIIGQKYLIGRKSSPSVAIHMINNLSKHPSKSIQKVRRRKL